MKKMWFDKWGFPTELKTALKYFTILTYLSEGVAGLLYIIAILQHFPITLMLIAVAFTMITCTSHLMSGQVNQLIWIEKILKANFNRQHNFR